MSLHRIVTLTARALRLRCPHCGGGPLFTVRWFRMRDRCPKCRLRLERGEQGYIVGAYMFNIVAAELLFAAIAAAWWRPPGRHRRGPRSSGAGRHS